jgi:hypothetical protein
MSSKRLRACGDGTWNDADSAGEFYKSRAYGTDNYRLSMAEVTGRRPALAQERIWSSVCSTAVSEWDCREMSGMSMVYSQPKSSNLLVTAVAVENRHHLGRSDPPAGSSRATRMAPGPCCGR